MAASVELDEATWELVRFAARVAGISESDVVARAVRAFVAPPPPGPARPDPWDEIAVYADYAGHRVDGVFLPATRRLTITSDPLAGRTYRSPSGGAAAVIGALNPGRVAGQTNGWLFWKVAATGDWLATTRQAGTARTRRRRGGTR